MFTKHFLKTLVFFTLIIALGLLGVLLIGYFDKGGVTSNTLHISEKSSGIKEVAK